MDALTVLVLLVVGVTVLSLASGVTAMARDEVVAHNDSLHWMMWRVIFQVVALALIAVALLGWS